MQIAPLACRSCNERPTCLMRRAGKSGRVGKNSLQERAPPKQGPLEEMQRTTTRAGRSPVSGDTAGSSVPVLF